MNLTRPTPELEEAYGDMVADFVSAGESPNKLGEGTTYWLVKDGRVLGTCRLRHALTEDLWRHGGHIGYDIRPSERNNGYATAMLDLLLEEAWDAGHSWVLVTVEEANLASRRVAEKNGAIYLDRVPGTGILRFVIDRGTHEEGLVAIGGEITAERVLEAYADGIFPWPVDEESPVLWWSPDPRFVLYPEHLHVGRSLEQRIGSGRFEVRLDTCFDEVIEGCTRPEGWITAEVQAAYTDLFHRGHAHCVGSWRDGKLAGGLYGVALGDVFFGESMFAREPDASKVAFVTLVRQLRAWGFGLVDCQQETEHLARFGAMAIPREQFLAELQRLLKRPNRPGPWRFEEPS